MNSVNSSSCVTMLYEFMMVIMCAQTASIRLRENELHDHFCFHLHFCLHFSVPRCPQKQSTAKTNDRDEEMQVEGDNIADEAIEEEKSPSPTPIQTEKGS
jgi:hypothetical protein